MLAAITAAFALITLAEYALGRDLGIDRLLVYEAGPEALSPGRIGASSALALLLLASAVWALDRPRGFGRWIRPASRFQRRRLPSLPSSATSAASRRSTTSARSRGWRFRRPSLTSCWRSGSRARDPTPSRCDWRSATRSAARSSAGSRRWRWRCRSHLAPCAWSARARASATMSAPGCSPSRSSSCWCR